MVADMASVILVKEGVGAKIECDAENRHIVGVHHAMTETISLPAGDHVHGALQNLIEHVQYRVGGLLGRWIAGLQGEVDELAQCVMLPGVVEELEMPEADV